MNPNPSNEAFNNTLESDVENLSKLTEFFTGEENTKVVLNFNPYSNRNGIFSIDAGKELINSSEEHDEIGDILSDFVRKCKDRFPGKYVEPAHVPEINVITDETIEVASFRLGDFLEDCKKTLE